MERICRKQQKKKKGIKFWFTFCAIIFGLFLIVGYFAKNISRAVFSYSESKVRALSVKAVNNAVSELVSNRNIYDNLVNITTNVDGDITLIQANSIQINMLMKDLIKTSQLKLEKIGADGINIPIGTFTGLNLLNGKGPNINIGLIPIGDVACSFYSEFNSAGINQTLHRLYVTIDTNVSVILPFSTNIVNTTTDILICESVIVGEIPEVYLNSNKLDGLLNLIP